EYDFEFKRKDGSVLWATVSGNPMFDDDGQFIGNFSMISDISDKRRTEETLRESEEKYRSVVEGSIQGITILRDDIIQFANQAFAKIFGYTSPDELVGKNIWETLIDPEEWAELKARNAKTLSGKPIPVHPGWKGIRKDGTSIWIQSTASPISLRDRPASLAFYLDVTELKKAEEALRESEERYRTLVQNVPIAVYRTTPGPKGRFLVTNPALLKMFGLESEEELKKITVADVYMNPKERKAFSDNLLVQGSVSGVELALKKKDGSPFWGSATARVVYDESGEVSCFDCTIVGITARKQAEEEKEKLQAQLFQAQKVEAIGTIAGGIAHNFNNLLMTIIGNTSLMLLETDSDHPNYEKLKIIEKQVLSGSKLTYQLLGYAREGGYEVKPLSLNQLIKETSDTFAMTKKEIGVHREHAEDLSGIKADQDQIEQILLNLYVNASDAMPGGGDLFLKTMNVTHKDMRSKPYEIKPGSYVLLTVRDTGTGMDRKTQEKIFDPFFTTKGMGRGTGLGLASVYGIVKAHGGYIDVESRKGHGTTFSIYLPASQKKALIKEKQLLKKILKGKETILLVDDEDIVLDVGEEMLKALGYKVLVARGGKEAIEIVSKAHRAKSKEQEGKERHAQSAMPPAPDMVLLDMVMPETGGGETYDRMKKINPDIKVLLLSGYSIDGQATEILNRGCNGFIQKPFNMEQLSQGIRRILDKK
ncbi:MAG: PAS domain S-box protein, partial [Desulfatiglandaceae bacterium]